jgi:hypothetical protein
MGEGKATGSSFKRSSSGVLRKSHPGLAETGENEVEIIKNYNKFHIE